MKKVEEKPRDIRPLLYSDILGLKDPEGKSRLKTESIQTMAREYGNDVTHRWKIDNWLME